MAEQNPESQGDSRERILELKPDAIFVLSGGTVDSEKNPGGLKSTPYGSKDHIGLFGGGKARVIAATQLSEFFPGTPVVTNSTVTTSDGKIEPHALVYAAELREMGVPNRQIITQEESNSTASELVELLRLAIKHNWLRVIILTNDYHIPRAQAMYKNLDHLFTPEYDETLSKHVSKLLKLTQERGLKITFQDAESVLGIRSPHYSRLIAEAKQTEAFRNRVKAEEKGTQDILEGRYKLRKPNSH